MNKKFYLKFTFMSQNSVEIILMFLSTFPLSFEPLLFFKFFCGPSLSKALAFGSLVGLDVDGSFQGCVPMI